MHRYFIIDFDSAFVEVEGLEELAKIALKDHKSTKTRKHNKLTSGQARKHKNKIIEEIEKITRQGMEGKIGFGESLEKRLALVKANKKHLIKLISLLNKKITPSVDRNREFFEQFSDRIYIISGGFKDFIWPVVKPFGIKESHVLANEFVFDKEGDIVGYKAPTRLLGTFSPGRSQEATSEFDNNSSRSLFYVPFEKVLLHSCLGEKVKVVDQLGLKGKIWVIGDGYTDYEIKKAGRAEKFFALTENVYRKAVADKADKILPNFDEFLYIYNLPRALSYPKHRIKVLLLENIHEEATKILRDEGYRIDIVDRVPGKQELEGMIKRVSIVGIRSRTRITAEVLEKAGRLWVIGVFGGGADHVDLAAATKKGIAVFAIEKRDRRSATKLSNKIIEFINTGNVTASVNMPQLALPEQKNTHRFIHIHQNVPGVLAEINGVLGKHNINIEGQYLRTNKEIGYLITDINKEYPTGVVEQLKNVTWTIRFRLLY